MYKIIITVKNEVKSFLVEDYLLPEVKEILDQPGITSIELHKIKTKTRCKKNEMGRNEKNER